MGIKSKLGELEYILGAHDMYKDQLIVVLDISHDGFIDVSYSGNNFKGTRKQINELLAPFIEGGSHIIWITQEGRITV